MGELFRRYCEEVKDIDLLTALESLLLIFQEVLIIVSGEIKDFIQEQLSKWVESLPKWLMAQLQLDFM